MSGIELCKIDRNQRSSIKVIGQVFKSVILVNINGILAAVDQHAAHERIRLELLYSVYFGDTSLEMTECVFPQDKFIFEMIENPSFSRVLLDAPIRIGIDEITWKKIQKPLQNWGIEGMTLNRVIWITKLPFVLIASQHLNNLDSLISDFYECIHNDNAKCPRELVEAMKTYACRGALKFKTEITLKQSQKLIKTLFQCKDPFHCAHGRPSLIPLLRLEN